MDFNEALKNYLLKTFDDARLVSGGSEIVMRCRFCGDSQSDIHAKHLYIKIDGDVPVYNCFKCNSRGILTEDTLRTFKPDYQDQDIAMMQNLRQNNAIMAKRLKRTKLSNNLFKVYNRWNPNDKMAQTKLKYINKRLGLNLSMQDALENKIVLNTIELLEMNHIDELTRPFNDLKTMSDFGIGFLSLDNGFITIKNLADPGTVSRYIDHKYNTYTIFKNADGIRSYMIPSMVHLDSIHPIKVHIAEGPFDILSIFYHLNNGNRVNSIYLAMCEKGYSKAIKMFLTRYGLMNAEYHLYVDNDVSNSDREIRSAVNLISSIQCAGYIHRNGFQDEKDMGVSSNRIKDFMIRI